MAGRLGSVATPGSAGGDVQTVLAGRAFGMVTLPTSSLAPVIDSATGDYFILNSAVATAVVFGAPLNPPTGGSSDVITIEHQNASGGAHSGVTFNAIFKPAGAFVTGATAKSRTIQFQWNGTNWVEVNRAAADI